MSPSEIISVLIVLSGVVATFTTVKINQKFMAKEVDELKDLFKESNAKQDKHEGKIKDLENEIKNIHAFGCERRGDCRIRNDK